MVYMSSVLHIPAHKIVREKHVYFKCPFGCRRMHKIGYANHSSPRSMADMHCPFKPACCEVLVVVDADTPRVSSLFSRTGQKLGKFIITPVPLRAPEHDNAWVVDVTPVATQRQHAMECRIGSRARQRSL